MSGSDIVFHGTTGVTGVAHGNSTPDPRDWLGRYRASQTLHSIQSSLTAAQTAAARHVLVDSARIGDGQNVYALDWVAIQTGAAAPSAARVAAFDDATGTFLLDRALEGGLGQIGDVYRIFEPGNVFENVSASEAAAGAVQYRCVCLLNGHGTIGSGQIRRVIFRDLGGVNATHHALVHQTTGAGTGAFLYRLDETTDVFDSLGQRVILGGVDGFASTTTWSQLYGVGVDELFDVGASGWAINQQCAVWIRRTVPELTRRRRSVAFQVLFVTDDVSSDPSPLSSSAVIAYDLDALQASAILTPDRYPTIRGGMRLRGDVSHGSVPLVGRPVRWDVRLGDLGTLVTEDDPVAGYSVTDDRGQAYSTFLSPSSDLAENAVSHPQLKIGAGDEIGQPKPRITLSGSTTFGFDVAGEIALVDLTSQYLTPPATGVWPGV